jgi:hypothetical protein
MNSFFFVEWHMEVTQECVYRMGLSFVCDAYHYQLRSLCVKLVLYRGL